MHAQSLWVFIFSSSFHVTYETVVVISYTCIYDIYGMSENK